MLYFLYSRWNKEKKTGGDVFTPNFMHPCFRIEDIVAALAWQDGSDLSDIKKMYHAKFNSDLQLDLENIGGRYKRVTYKKWHPETDPDFDLIKWNMGFWIEFEIVKAKVWFENISNMITAVVKQKKMKYDIFV